MKAILITLLLCVTINPVYAQNKHNGVAIQVQSSTLDDCSKESLLIALTKAAKQLPEPSINNYTIFTLGSSDTIYFGSVDKYSGLSYVERLKAIATDKEKEAKDARDLAEKEESRENDIKLVKRLAKECGVKSILVGR